MSWRIRTREDKRESNVSDIGTGLPPEDHFSAEALKEEYYDELLKEYGPARELEGSLNILLVADLHGRSAWEDPFSKVSGHYDACFVLGDLSSHDLDVTINKVDCPIYGIYGNHDERGMLERFGIPDINETVIEINGIRIAGLEGSPLYNLGRIGYTQEDCSEIMKHLPEADLLLSHASPFDPTCNDGVHCGFKGVSEYIYRNHVPYCFYGHNHDSTAALLSNGCWAQCIYGVEDVVIGNKRYPSIP